MSTDIPIFIDEFMVPDPKTILSISTRSELYSTYYGDYLPISESRSAASISDTETLGEESLSGKRSLHPNCVDA